MWRQYHIAHESYWEFLQILTLFYIPNHSQTLGMDVTAVLFIELLDMQLHCDSMFDSLYIVGSCRFWLYLLAIGTWHSPLSSYIRPFDTLFYHATTRGTPGTSSTTCSTRSLGSHSTSFTSTGGLGHPAQPWERPIWGYWFTLPVLWTWCRLHSS